MYRIFMLHLLPVGIISREGMGFEENILGTLKMASVRELIREVSLRPVLYDPHNPSYKDNNSRLIAWQNISKRLKIPVTDCQVKWGTLRRCLANARKRQLHRKQSGSKCIKKWRYQDEMEFLTPYIDRKDNDFIILPKRNKNSKSINEIELEDVTYVSEVYENDQANANGDDSLDIKPELVTLRDGINRSQEPEQWLTSPQEMYIEEDEIEGYTLDAREWMRSTEETGEENVSSTRDVRPDILLDEMDTFFLSMSKALKKLPIVEQIKARSQVYAIVTKAEMNWLHKSELSSTEDTNK